MPLGSRRGAPGRRFPERQEQGWVVEGTGRALRASGLPVGAAQFGVSRTLASNCKSTEAGLFSCRCGALQAVAAQERGVAQARGRAGAATTKAGVPWPRVVVPRWGFAVPWARTQVSVRCRRCRTSCRFLPASTAVNEASAAALP